MSNPLAPMEEEMLEPCIDALDEVTNVLSEFPDAVIVHALRAHLVALLSVLVESEVWTPDEARAFVTAMEADVVG